MENNSECVSLHHAPRLHHVSFVFSSILKQYKTTVLKTEYRFNKDILDLINPNYQYQLKAPTQLRIFLQQTYACGG